MLQDSTEMIAPYSKSIAPPHDSSSKCVDSNIPLSGEITLLRSDLNTGDSLNRALRIIRENTPTESSALQITHPELNATTKGRSNGGGISEITNLSKNIVTPPTPSPLGSKFPSKVIMVRPMELQVDTTKGLTSAPKQQSKQTSKQLSPLPETPLIKDASLLEKKEWIKEEKTSYLGLLTQSLIFKWNICVYATVLVILVFTILILLLEKDFGIVHLQQIPIISSFPLS